MSYRRFRMDLAVREPIPKELQVDLDDIKEHILRLQHFSVKINEGHLNEENTTWVDEHTCNHDIGKPCEKAHEPLISQKRKEENAKNDTMGELRSLAWVPFTKWGLARRK